MFNKKFFVIALILISMAICRLEAAGDSGMVRIHDNTSAVAIEDIIGRGKGGLSESDVKRICAEITGRYHDRGYTAFYIKRAELNQDGTADLYFHEAAVEDIVVTGVLLKRDEIAASIFNKGDLFNEFTLKNNISGAKKKFGIKKLNVAIKRGDGDQIVLTAEVSEKINGLETGIFNSPIYGLLPELKYIINYSGFLAGVSAASSFNQSDRSYSGGSVFFNSDNTPGSSYFLISADLTESKDSYYAGDELFYTHRKLQVKGGFFGSKGPAGIGFFITGISDELKDYPGEDGGVSFSGLQVKIKYDDTLYRLDFQELTSGEMDFCSGWNFIEDTLSTRLFMNYLFNIPLYRDYFFSLNGNGIYISDKERLSHFYVYDRLFPCRDDDFSTTSWRITAGADIAYEVMKGTAYLLPGLKWGIYNTEQGSNNICAAALKFILNAGSVKTELSYMYDVSLDIKNGFFTFSAVAVY